MKQLSTTQPDYLAEPAAPAQSLSFQELSAFLRRRRNTVLAVFLVILMLGIVYTAVSKSTYHATAKILVDEPTNSTFSVDTSNQLSSILIPSPAPSADTTVQEIDSPTLEDQVMRQYGIVKFNIAQIEKTDIIGVSADASSAKTAADAANGLASLFIQRDADRARSGFESARLFVQAKGAAAHKRLAAAEQALRAYQATSLVPNIDHVSNSRLDRVDTLNATYQDTQNMLAEVRSKLTVDQKNLAGEPSSVPVDTLVTNPQVAQLQSKLSDLEVQRQGMLQPGGFTAKSSRVRALDGQIASTKQLLAAQPALIDSRTGSPNVVRETLRQSVADLQSQESALVAQQSALSTQLSAARAAAGLLPSEAVTLSQLTRERDRAAAADAMFSGKLLDLTLREQALHQNVHLAETAQPPMFPVRSKLLNIVFACLLGLLAGVGIGMLQDALDDRLHTVEDADRTLGLPALGYIPALPLGGAKLLPQMERFDPAVQGYRSLRTSVTFAHAEQAPRTILVTSAGPGEGKTTTATNLALAAANEGRSVILVDVDFYQPSVHQILEIPSTPGLTDVLLRGVALEDALQVYTPTPGLRALSCGHPAPDGVELLNSRRFQTILDELKDMADVVVLDCSPVLATADAQMLATQVDGVIIVSEVGGTKRDAAKQTLALLRQVNAPILGVAYNKAPARAGYYYHYGKDGRPEMNGRAPKKALMAPAPARNGK